MGTIPKKYSFFSVFFTLLPSLLQLHARESQFFSKFSNHNPQETQLIPTNNIQPQQQEPNFIPQTQDSAGYGLYGHLSPSTTSPATITGGSGDTLPENYNTVAYTTPIRNKDAFVTTDPRYDNMNEYNGDSTMYNNQKQDRFFDNERYYNNNGENMYNSPKHATYNSQKQGMGETSFMDTAVDGGNMYNTEKHRMSDTSVSDDEKYYQGSHTYNSQKQHGMATFDGGNTYNSEKHEVSDTRVSDDKRYYQGSVTYNSQKLHGMGDSDGGNMYNTEKQGMSDTRFMDNGKYYYDLNGENEDKNSRRNGYNSRGYFGNSDNSYDRYNSNARFQENQEDGFTP